MCGECIRAEHAGPELRLHQFLVRRSRLFEFERMLTSRKLGTGEHVSAKQLGMRVLLGHTALGNCSQPVLQEDFPILTVAGVVNVDIEYCGCNTALSREAQLMAARMLPVAHCAVDFQLITRLGIVGGLNSSMLSP